MSTSQIDHDLRIEQLKQALRDIMEITEFWDTERDNEIFRIAANALAGRS